MLLDELKAARDRDAACLTGTWSGVAATTWGEAISIVERYLNPMPGLDPGDLTNLRDRMPCIRDERHTFDAGAKTCLCGALSVGIVSPMPTACLYVPAKVAS
jgi:hypothetical protein